MTEADSPQAARSDIVDACTQTPSAIGARRAPVAEGFLRLYRRARLIGGRKVNYGEYGWGWGVVGRQSD